MKPFSKEQMDALRPYEKHFAEVKSQVLRYPGRTALETMHNALKDATGYNQPLNTTCGQCIFRLVSLVAEHYERSKDAKVVAVSAKKHTTRRKKVTTDAV